MTAEYSDRAMEIRLVEDSPSDAELAIFALDDGHVQQRTTVSADHNEVLSYLNRYGRYAHAPRPNLILLDLFLEALVMTTEYGDRAMEILLVEDSPSDAELAIIALDDGHVQHRTTVIADGNEALNYLNRYGRYAHAPRPDLVLLDLNLPGLDGRLVLSAIKSDFLLKTIPVVIMTSSESHEDRIRSELLQVEGYMVKPLEMHKFVMLVKQLADYWDSDICLPAAVSA